MWIEINNANIPEN
jgi:hypothetical protein